MESRGEDRVEATYRQVALGAGILDAAGEGGADLLSDGVLAAGAGNATILGDGARHGVLRRLLERVPLELDRHDGGGGGGVAASIEGWGLLRRRGLRASVVKRSAAEENRSGFRERRGLRNARS